MHLSKNSFIHQNYGDYNTFQYDTSSTVKGDGISSSTESTMFPSTEPKLLATIRDVSTSTAEAVTRAFVENTKTTINNTLSSISSAITSPSVGLADSTGSNQTVTETVLNKENIGRDIFVTVSSNISVITPSIDTDQSASQTTINDILTSISSNITSDTPRITTAIGTNQTLTDAITESILNTETIATDILTSVSSSISEISTSSNETTTEEVSSTISSVVSNVTESIVDNVTEIFTTTCANVTETLDNDDITGSNDIVVYVILGIIIALLIIIIVISYVFCKKCKSHYSKSGDYYITQYTNTTSC